MYEPPFPPVYGTDALTPLADVPLVKVPVMEVEPQFKAEILAVEIGVPHHSYHIVLNQ